MEISGTAAALAWPLVTQTDTMIVEPHFLTHWKTKRLKRLLGNDAPFFVMNLWAHCQRSRSDRIRNVTPEILASICDYEDDPNKLYQAMLACRFIDLDGNEMVAHGWAEANATLIGRWKGGQIIKDRAKPGLSPGSAGGSAGRLAGGSNDSAEGLAGGLAGSAGGLATGSADSDKSRVEKRGVEKKEEIEQRAPPGQSSGAREEENVQHAEAQNALRDIAKTRFGMEIGSWGARPIFDHWLNEALPIPSAQFEAFRWLYGLPEDDEIFKDRQHPAFTQRKQSFFEVLKNLQGECQKAVGVQKKMADALEVDPIT